MSQLTPKDIGALNLVVIGIGKEISATRPSIRRPPHRTKQAPIAAYTDIVATAEGVGVTVTFNDNKQKFTVTTTRNSPPISTPNSMGISPPRIILNCRLKKTIVFTNGGSPAAMHKSGTLANSEQTSLRRCRDKLLSGDSPRRFLRAGADAVGPALVRSASSSFFAKRAPNVPCLMVIPTTLIYH